MTDDKARDPKEWARAICAGEDASLIDETYENIDEDSLAVFIRDAQCDGARPLRARLVRIAMLAAHSSTYKKALSEIHRLATEGIYE